MAKARQYARPNRRPDRPKRHHRHRLLGANLQAMKCPPIPNAYSGPPRDDTPEEEPSEQGSTASSVDQNAGENGEAADPVADAATDAAADLGNDTPDGDNNDGDNNNGDNIDEDTNVEDNTNMAHNGPEVIDNIQVVANDALGDNSVGQLKSKGPPKHWGCPEMSNEIHAMILRLVTPTDSVIRWEKKEYRLPPRHNPPRGDQPEPKNTLAPLLLNRHFSAITRHLLYGQNTFAFVPSVYFRPMTAPNAIKMRDLVNDMVKTVGAHNAALVRRIIVPFPMNATGLVALYNGATPADQIQRVANARTERRLLVVFPNLVRITAVHPDQVSAQWVRASREWLRNELVLEAPAGTRVSTDTSTHSPLIGRREVQLPPNERRVDLAMLGLSEFLILAKDQWFFPWDEGHEDDD